MSGRFRSFAGSYRLRLVLGYALVVALLAGAWAWSLYGPVNARVVEQQRSHLRAIAQAGSLALARSGVSAPRTASELASRTGLRITVVAADGTVVADTAEDPARMQNHATRPEIREALAGRVGYDTRTSATLGTAQLYVAVPGKLGGSTAVLRVSEPLARVDQLAASARGTGVLLLGLALLAAGYVGVRLSRSAAEPVLRLKQAAEAMAAGRLDTPVPTPEGELSGLAAALETLRDEIRGRMDDLVTEQDTLRTVLDGLEVGVLLFDGERVALANASASRMFRPPAAGWLGADVADTGMPASLAAAVSSVLSRREMVALEVGPDPECRFFRLAATPLEGAGESPRTIVVLSDITEVRRLDQVRRDFVANASHELKTPTAAIQLLADSAATAQQDGDVEAALVFAGQIRGEADRLRRLVLDLLDLSRLESVPEPGTITDIRAAVSNAVAAHGAAARAAGLALTTDDSGVSGRDVYAAVEPTDVAIALDNLLANAVSYTERGGVTVSIEADEATVTLTVRDTGIGIPPEHLPRVFERFYRVDGARSRASGGTGLGLSLVKHVTERGGGSVDVVSRVGEGTTFILRLPRAH